MTSIEWLKKEIEGYGSSEHLYLDWSTFDELCEQAKEMHKQEIIDAYLIGQSLGFDDSPRYMAEKYYKEEFKKD
jgi:hypothetical protein